MAQVTIRTLARVRVTVRDMGHIRALWLEFQSASLLLCQSQLPTVEQLGQTTAKPLARVWVRVRVRERPCPALCAEFQSASLLLCESQLSTVDQLGQITAGPLARVRIRVKVMVSDGPVPALCASISVCIAIAMLV